MDDIDDVVVEPENDGMEEKAEGKLKKLRDELKEVKKERDEHLAGWQRSKADYVNLSRRMREQEDTQTKLIVAKVARGNIAVFDSVEAAYKSALASSDKAVAEGISQVIKQLEQLLKELGIVRFTPKKGDEFNPNKHEPVAAVACESEKEDNTVSETLQSGYEMGDMVVRPARVAVLHYKK